MTFKESGSGKHSSTEPADWGRTGKLHYPTDVCGPLYEEELEFWGLDSNQGITQFTCIHIPLTIGPEQKQFEKLTRREELLNVETYF